MTLTTSSPGRDAPTVGGSSDQSVQSALRVEFLTEIEQIEALRDPWRALEARVKDRTVYVSHDYIMAMYFGYRATHHTAFAEPFVCTAWEGPDLVAVFPFFIARATLGKIPIHRLSLAGDILQAAEFLISEEHPQALEQSFEHLAGWPGWDVLILNGQDLTSPRGAAIQEAVHRFHLGWEEFPDHSYAVADLSAGYDAYAKARGYNFRHKNNQIAHKVEAGGAWRIDRPDLSAGVEVVEKQLSRMFAIAENGWRARKSGIEEERTHHPFHETLVRRFAPRGMVDLSILVLQERDAAFSLAVLERGIYFHILIAYDEEFADFSPGTFLLQEIFRVLPDRGIHSVISHGDYEYKRRWASTFFPRQAGFVFADTVRAHLAHFSRFQLGNALKVLRRIRHPWQKEPSPGDLSPSSSHH
jgi:CelD/BcsL family acetyltransferase involved in cellulose biosynthesis